MFNRQPVLLFFRNSADTVDILTGIFNIPAIVSNIPAIVSNVPKVITDVPGAMYKVLRVMYKVPAIITGVL